MQGGETGRSSESREAGEQGSLRGRHRAAAAAQMKSGIRRDAENEAAVRTGRGAKPTDEGQVRRVTDGQEMWYYSLL